jgi:hypothetical protein
MRLNGTGDAIEAAEYPCTTDELCAEYGDREVEFVGGTETLSTVLSRTEGETLRTPEDARLAVFNNVTGDAVGRRHYSDRDPTPNGVDGPDPVSF